MPPPAAQDEPFHVPQTQRYCRGDFATWDTKITTFPGLYVAGTAWAHLLHIGSGALSALGLTQQLTLVSDQDASYSSFCHTFAIPWQRPACCSIAHPRLACGIPGLQISDLDGPPFGRRRRAGRRRCGW